MRRSKKYLKGSFVNGADASRLILRNDKLFTRIIIQWLLRKRRLIIYRLEASMLYTAPLLLLLFTSTLDIFVQFDNRLLRECVINMCITSMD